ncbi:MAG: GAF domain-containing protein [Deltaproteobacteria bacterium]|nr:GAF domain-containing protein [Deltaproteobacteria bacterium]
MDDKDKTIAALRAELEAFRARERDYRDSRSAMLYMMEDLNESTAAITRAKKDWEATFDAIKDPIFMHDMEFNIVRANRAYAQYAGLKLPDIVGKPYYSIFPIMEKPFKQCVMALTSGEDGEEEIIVQPLNMVFRARFYPVKDETGGYMHSIHILEDITAAKRFEARLREEADINANLLAIAEATASTKDIDQFMEHVVKSAALATRADICLSYLRLNGGAFHPAHAWGLAGTHAAIFRTRPLDPKLKFIKAAIEKKEPLIVRAPAGTAELPFAMPAEETTMAVVPLLSRSGAIGLLIMLYGAKKEPSEGDLRVLRGMFHQVSTALEEARLYRESVDRAIELSRRIETIKVMHEIDISILSTLESADILDMVARLVARLIPCDRATVAVADRERGGFVYEAGFGIDLPKGAFVPFSETSATTVLDTGASEYTADLTRARGNLPVEERLLRDGFASHLRVPLMVKGEPAAVLSVGAKRPAAFSREDLSTLEKLASQMSVALENARLVGDLRELFLSTVRALSNAIDAKSPWTRGHSERVTNYAVATAREMGVPDKTVEDLRLAGLLHDIGKIGTYDAILNKPDKLNDEEYGIMKEHPARGASVLEPIRQLRSITPWIRHHHEQYGGRGYPDGLKGADIPLMARILAVADTFDSMTAERPYRETPGRARAFDELKKYSGTQFDPKVVEAFLKTMEKGGPSGTECRPENIAAP